MIFTRESRIAWMDMTNVKYQIASQFYEPRTILKGHFISSSFIQTLWYLPYIFSKFYSHTDTHIHIHSHTFTHNFPSKRRAWNLIRYIAWWPRSQNTCLTKLDISGKHPIKLHYQSNMFFPCKYSFSTYIVLLACYISVCVENCSGWFPVFLVVLIFLLPLSSPIKHWIIICLQ